MRYRIVMILFLIPFFCEAQVKVIPAGTTVNVTLQQDLSSKNAKVGDVINFITSDEVIVNDYVLVHKGVKVTGTVTESVKAKGRNKAGTLNFTIEKMYLDNDKVIKLTTELKNKAKDNSVSVVKKVLLPGTALRKGNNVSFEKGYVFIVYVDADTPL
ncbi:MAG: hypothetical protein ABIN36_12415 [Ferruginibacter sp.]